MANRIKQHNRSSDLSAWLYERSRTILLTYQQPGGGYLACPNMPDYQFSWFRDGAFIAYALTLDGDDAGVPFKGNMNGQWDSANNFHAWCVEQINGREAALERAIVAAQQGAPLVVADTLNARYRIDGDAGPDDWPEFQLDGPGLWLWSLEAFARITRVVPLPAAWEHAVRLTARYLAAMWQTPCYDCWEERGDQVHTSTLAAIYTGLKAAIRLLPDLEPSLAGTLEAIRTFIRARCLTPTGELAKSVGLDAVDANLFLAALPDGLLTPDDPLMVKTMARIRRDLCPPAGGVYRHLEDTYYGGGVWVLLALILAWQETRAGDPVRARELLAWAERQHDADGNLPEQVAESLLAPGYLDHWVQVRGPIASPLLWTHAQYMIAQMALAEPHPKPSR